MKKPTMQEIAAMLQTSRISVWKALNNRPGISAQLREKILNKAYETGYINASAQANHAMAASASAGTIAAVVSRPESSSFWMQIIHQIAKELSVRSVNLMYTYLPSRYTEGDDLPAVLSGKSVSGIIVLNIYTKPQLKMLAALPLPKVFLDSVPTMPFERLGGDLVLIEGRAAVREITGNLLDGGRRRLGFIGDINYAQTNMDRYLGFVDAFHARGLSCDEAACLVGPLQLTTHYEQISKFLRSLHCMPDGFVCASDYIAHFIQQYFTEHGVDRRHTCITGFDNNRELVNIAGKITTVDVQTKSIGARLANKIMFAVDHPSAYPEVCYISSKVLFRS